MSIGAESEQEFLPAHSAHIFSELSVNEWRKNIRGCVTALKCHILATNGLTPEGIITQPYSVELLLKASNNDCFVREASKCAIENYVANAMAKFSHKDNIDGKETSLLGHGTNEERKSDPVAYSILFTNMDESKSAGQDSSENLTNSPKKSFTDSSHNFSEVQEISSVQESQVIKDIKSELNEKTNEVERLSKIRDEVENELQDLTANLFQEAHSMVQGANQRAVTAEKAHKEAKMQVEVLQAEVAALKALVLTSTPSCPNPHLHPQIISRGTHIAAEAGKIFQRGHRKSPSDFDLKYGRDTTPPSSPLKEDNSIVGGAASSTNSSTLNPDCCWEVDPVVHREFVAWRQTADLSRCDPFMSRVYREDIDLCLSFPNRDLANRLVGAIESNTLHIEEVKNSRENFNCPGFHPDDARKCILLEVPRYCKYRFRLSDDDNSWFYISQLARNRVISVCDFLSYLRYIQRGLVKSSIHESYWEIMRLRRQMTLARLGL